MERFFVIALALSIFISGCGANDSSIGDRISVVCTIFPQYDWAKQILGDSHIDVTLLLDSGIDLHSYQPTVEDIVKISSCDMFIYTGGESDKWVEDALETATNKNMIVINLLDVLGDSVKTEELVDGMEHGHAHAHGEIHYDEYKDRPLSDWQGNWVTIETALETGDLDDYIAHQAEQNETDVNSQKAIYKERWKSDYKVLDITGDSATFDGVSSNYHYIGLKIVEGNHGDSAWYGFKADSPNVPAYIAFTDHGTGNEHEQSGHFHLRYGNQSFEALVEMENWSPTYFPSDASGKEIAEEMSGHSHAEEYDEHVWLSLRNTQTLCAHIAEKLGEIDSDNKELYKSNATEYNSKLRDLDEKFDAAVSDAPIKTLLFGDRFPFRYMIDDYNLDYYAAFPGCSAETEASFETIIFLAKKADELGLHSVIVTESSDKSIAKTIISTTESKNQQILVLDAMQSVTSAQAESGTTYLSVMESNLNVLKQALEKAA